MGWKKRFYVVPVQSDSAEVCVLYPHFPSEFDVQHELYDRLFMICYELDNGCEIKSEITAFCDDIRARFDLMVFKNKLPVCAIEVKRFSKDGITPQSEKQKIKYEMFARTSRIPVLYCMGENEIDKVAASVKEIIR